MVNIKDSDKKKIMDEIHYFFKEEYNLDLGYIGQDNVYNFFMDILGSYIYNAALDDASSFCKRQLEIWSQIFMHFIKIFKMNKYTFPIF